MTTRIFIASLALFTSLVWGEDIKHTYYSMVGQPMNIVVDKDQLSFQVEDITESSIQCTDEDALLCFFSDNLDVVIPVNEPVLKQKWSKYGTAFEDFAKIPELKLLGSVYENVHVIQGSRHGQRKGLGGIESFVLYYSYENGLLGYILFSSSGAHLFLSANISGLRKNP